MNRELITDNYFGALLTDISFYVLRIRNSDGLEPLLDFTAIET